MGRKRKVGKTEEERKEGKEESAMSPSENSLKIHWLQMHQNQFSTGAVPRTPLRELATPSLAGEVLPSHTFPASRLSASLSRLRTDGASVLRHMGLCR